MKERSSREARPNSPEIATPHPCRALRPDLLPTGAQRCLFLPRPAGWAGDGSGLEMTHLSQGEDPHLPPAWFHTGSTSLLVTKQNRELEERG